MEMIRHEDIGVNLPTRLSASLAQRVDEALAIRIIHEDQFAPVTAIHDVMNRTSILDSQLAGRDGGGFGRFMYQYQELTPFPLFLFVRHRGGLLFKLTQQVGDLRAGCLNQIAPPAVLAKWRARGVSAVSLQRSATSVQRTCRCCLAFAQLPKAS